MAKKATDVMSDNENKYRYLRAAAHITQFGLDMVTPIVLFTILAVWLKNKLDMGGWVVIVAIIIGVACSGLNMYKFIKTAEKETGGREHDEKRKD